MKWQLHLERRTTIRMSEVVGLKHLRHFKQVLERNQSYGFRCRIPSVFPEPTELDDNTGNRWLYAVKLTVFKDHYRSEEAAHRHYQKALETIGRTAAARGWHVVTETDSVALTSEPINTPRPSFVYRPLTDEALAQFWPGVYERDAHIRVIHRSVASFLETRQEERSHVLLYGLPAGCKTTVFGGFKRFYEQGDTVERVAMLDATTLTKAGLENWILERARANCLPEIICLEEIEKHQPQNLLSLLSLMASGQLMRTNSKIGRVVADAKVLVWATCNDEQTLQNFHRGALWSRFTHQLHCARPSPALMEKILLYKVTRLPQGDVRWVKPVLDYAYNEVGNDDPRFIVGLLDGRGDLLDGSYLDDLRKISRAKAEEESRRHQLQESAEYYWSPQTGRRFLT